MFKIESERNVMNKRINCQLKLELQLKGMGGEVVSVMLPPLEYAEESGQNQSRETMSIRYDGKRKQAVLLEPAELVGMAYAHPTPYDPASTRFCQTSHWKPGGRFPGDDLPGAGERAKEDFRRLTHLLCL
jgi:hypothetical protein